MFKSLLSVHLDQQNICSDNHTYKQNKSNMLVLRIHSLTTRNQMLPVQTLNLLLFAVRNSSSKEADVHYLLRDFFCISVFFNFGISATFNVMISLQTKCPRAWQMEPLTRCGPSTSHLLNLTQR